MSTDEAERYARIDLCQFCRPRVVQATVTVAFASGSKSRLCDMHANAVKDIPGVSLYPGEHWSKLSVSSLQRPSSL